MNAPKQGELIKSLDRVIAKLENKLKSSRLQTSLITSQPTETNMAAALNLKAIK